MKGEFRKVVLRTIDLQGDQLSVFTTGDASSGSVFRRTWSFVHIDPVSPKNHCRIYMRSVSVLSKFNPGIIRRGKAHAPGSVDSTPRIIHHTLQRLEHAY